VAEALAMSAGKTESDLGGGDAEGAEDV